MKSGLDRFLPSLSILSINLTFCGPCIVIYLRVKDQQDAIFALNLQGEHKVFP